MDILEILSPWPPFGAAAASPSGSSTTLDILDILSIWPPFSTSTGGAGPAQGSGPLFFYVDATPLSTGVAPAIARITAEPL